MNSTVLVYLRTNDCHFLSTVVSDRRHMFHYVLIGLYACPVNEALSRGMVARLIIITWSGILRRDDAVF